MQAKKGIEDYAMSLAYLISRAIPYKLPSVTQSTNISYPNHIHSKQVPIWGALVNGHMD